MIPSGSHKLRMVLGAALLVSCFVLALSMRQSQAPKKEQLQPKTVSQADVKPLGESLIMRIARPGEAAATLERADSSSPWTIRDVDFEVDQHKITALITTLEAHCSGAFYTARTEAENKTLRTAAEVLVGQHAFRLIEHERGTSYSLERAGHPCQKPGEFISVEDAQKIGLATVQLRAK